MQILWTSFKLAMIFLPAKYKVKKLILIMMILLSCFLVPLLLFLLCATLGFWMVAKAFRLAFPYTMEVDYPYIYDRHPICSQDSFHSMWLTVGTHSQSSWPEDKRTPCTRLWAPQDL